MIHPVVMAKAQEKLDAHKHHWDIQSIVKNNPKLSIRHLNLGEIGVTLTFHEALIAAGKTVTEPFTHEEINELRAMNINVI